MPNVVGAFHAYQYLVALIIPSFRYFRHFLVFPTRYRWLDTTSMALIAQTRIRKLKDIWSVLFTSFPVFHSSFIPFTQERHVQRDVLVPGGVFVQRDEAPDITYDILGTGILYD